MRARASKMYLDLAEKCPGLKMKTIEWLKTIRKHQRKWAEESHKKACPPAGSKLKLLYFRMFEVFQLEDFDLAWSGIKELFAEKKQNYAFTRLESHFEDIRQSINSGGTGKVGIVYGKRPKGVLSPSIPWRIDDEMPEQVFCIEITSHKFLPSAFVLAFDVYLTDEASEQIIAISDRPLLSEIQFNKLLPWQLLHGGYSEKGVDALGQAIIQDGVRKLRIAIENTLTPFLKGVFARQSIPSDEPKLPVMEIFSLQGLDYTKESFEDWKKKNYYWWRFLGFNFNLDSFQDEQFVFMPPDRFSRAIVSTYRVLALWEKVLSSSDIKAFGGDEKSALENNTSYLLDELLPSVSLIEFLRVFRGNFENYRSEVYDLIKSQKATHKELSLCFQRETIIKRELMVLERTAMEYAVNKRFVSHGMHYNLEALRAIINMAGRIINERNLKDELKESIEFGLGRLKSQLSFLADTVSEYSASQNTRAIYFFTWVVTLATVLNCITSPKIFAFVENFFHWLLRVLRMLL